MLQLIEKCSNMSKNVAEGLEMLQIIEKILEILKIV